MAIDPATGILILPSAADPARNTEPALPLFGEDGLTFWDLLDVINPLQHIPVVSTIYRAITGDEIDPGARVAGGALFGGPIGAGTAMANVMLENETGKDAGAHVLALFLDEEAPESSGTALADASPAAVKHGIRRYESAALPPAPIHLTDFGA